MSLALIAGVYSASIAFPKWAFPFEDGTDGLRVHAALPLPDETEDFAEMIKARLESFGMNNLDTPLNIYVTGDDWRRTWFFGQSAPLASAAYPMLASDLIFLADVDIVADKVRVSNSGPEATHSASVFAIRELARVATRQMVGAWEFIQLDPMLKNGIADYVAFGPIPKQATDEANVRSRRSDDTRAAQHLGFYPEARLAVTYALGTDRSVAYLLAR